MFWESGSASSVGVLTWWLTVPQKPWNLTKQRYCYIALYCYIAQKIKNQTQLVMQCWILNTIWYSAYSSRKTIFFLVNNYYFYLSFLITFLQQEMLAETREIVVGKHGCICLRRRNVKYFGWEVLYRHFSEHRNHLSQSPPSLCIFLYLLNKHFSPSNIIVNDHHLLQYRIWVLPASVLYVSLV